MRYTVGFPRIGEQRELKKALEAYWSGKTELASLEETAADLRKRHWVYQKNAGMDMISCNDFSFYDNMIDMMFLLNATPEKYNDIGDRTAKYFAIARGDSTHKAMEMTKWFNTNYHYIVPELEASMDFKADLTKIKSEYAEAKELGINAKINMVGLITFLKLSKYDNFEDICEKLLTVYESIVKEISELNETVTIQFEESFFVRTPKEEDLTLLKIVYDRLTAVANNVKIYVATYFEHSNEANSVLADTAIDGMFLDFVAGSENVESLKLLSNAGKEIGIGIVNGRNVWIADIEAKVAELKEMTKDISTPIYVGSSCSLLHVPFTLKYEEKMDSDIKSWISYALEKLEEIRVTDKLYRGETLDANETKIYEANKKAIASRKTSEKVNDKAVQERVENLTDAQRKREMGFEERIKLQHEYFSYPSLPTTTIGSFPQTPELRKLRRDFKKGAITLEAYDGEIAQMTDDLIKLQEDMDIDVLVHGEYERNDMVEYFGEQLNGVAFSSNGWVQSYGSRCVKPPLIFGDVSRPEPMTVRWSAYAQSKTDRIMKGMLTGPVTMLNWAFVRDDQPKSATSYQMALAIADEVSDLQDAGIHMIQVDEAALREGYPLRDEKTAEYTKWAIDSFLMTTAPAKPTTQIHTHMCYSDFDDIIEDIEAMDADVISIENARSDNSLLEIFKERGYAGEIGPGIYDIHSPRVPPVEELVEQIEELIKVLPLEKIWVNPDCGLKTRKWPETTASLENMVKATKIVREKL